MISYFLSKITIYMIVQDLWPTIVSYIPLESRIDLSKVCPIFDKMIAKTGIKVFYKDSVAYEIGVFDKIIQLYSGAKYLLLGNVKFDEYHDYKIAGTDIYVCSGPINYEKVDCNKSYDYFCEETNIAIRKAYFGIYIAEHCNDIGFRYCINIVKRITNDFNRISFSKKIVALIPDICNRIEYEDFTVLYERDKWQ